ncbi:MAG: sensor histidine kinase [Alphaproteobacteria bacterium]|nr:sensor histidine kinase [Alphaproteobacteria bacterium]
MSRLPDLRALLRGPEVSADTRAAFAEHTRELTRLYFHWLGFAIAGAALLWWPLDLVIFDARIQQAFGHFRALLIVLDVSLALLLPRLAFVHRHAHLTAVLACMLNLGLAGWTLGELGQGDPLWVSYGFIMPLFAILLLIPLGPRALATSAFAATLCVAWALHPASQLGTQDALAVFSYMGFCALISIGIGHALYLLVQRDFQLRRDVEQQREALAELAERLELRVAEQTRAIREMHRRAQNLRAEQRVELARDLHDGLGQELTSLRLLVGLGQQLQAHGDADGVLTELDGQVARVQQALRQVLQALRPQKLAELGLAEALRELVGELERRSGLRITLSVGEDLPEPLPSEHSLALYRIAQEGLNNAIRHARARAVDLNLYVEGLQLHLEVLDDGVGISPGRVGAGLGTRGAAERAEALGGEARWTTSGGTCLHVSLPLPESP